MEYVASFRDPSGSCCLVDNRVLRIVGSRSAAECQEFLRSPCAQHFVSQGQLVSTREVDANNLAGVRLPRLESELESESGAIIFEHERVSFASYPHEWPPEMLWSAGCLTLELALAALEDGYGLKDATPDNVLFRGSEPVFVDVLSFERRNPNDPVWKPYGQFVRTFLLPLLANRRWEMKLADVFLTRRDGLQPEEVYSWCSLLERFRPPALTLVSLPTWLRGRANAKGADLYQNRTVNDPEKAKFIVASVLKQLRRSLQKLEPAADKSTTWSNYMDTHSYSGAAFMAKERFVENALREWTPKRVLDVGANTGHFSAMAARSGAEVVALDIDPACVGAIWREAHRQKLNILPLVVDLARPVPALGWRNRERPSFLERATGRFDCVFMLAVLHHLLVTERIPLAEVLQLATELTTSLLIIEFVSPEDRMFRQLTRGRDELHAGLNEAVFERACARHFEIVTSLPIPDSQRRLYCLKRKSV